MLPVRPSPAYTTLSGGNRSRNQGGPRNTLVVDNTILFGAFPLYLVRGERDVAVFDSLGRKLRTIADVAPDLVKKQVDLVGTFVVVGGGGGVDFYGATEALKEEDYSVKVDGTVLGLSSDGIDRVFVLVGHFPDHREVLVYTIGSSLPGVVRPLVSRFARAVHSIASSWYGPVVWGDDYLVVGNRDIEMEGIDAVAATRGTITAATGNSIHVWSAENRGARRTATVTAKARALTITDEDAVVVSFDENVLILRAPDFHPFPLRAGRCLDISRGVVLTRDGFTRGDGQIVDPRVDGSVFIVAR